MFLPSLLEIGQVVLGKKIFKKFVNEFLLFRNNLPLEKGGALLLNKLESPSPTDALFQVILEKKMKTWKINGNADDNDNDDDGQRTNFDKKSSPSAQMNKQVKKNYIVNINFLKSLL